MNKADEALADVRRWLCDSLSDGDAGKVCGMLSVVSRHVNELESMLSVVSRHVNELETENDKLREQVTRLQSEWESERDYADQMEAKEKRAVAENDKLRELVHKYGEYLDQDHCEGCVCKSRCNDGYIDECWQLTEIRELASELGIRVGE